EIRLLEPVVPGRPARGVPGDVIVTARNGAERVDRADGNRVGRIRRRGDAGIFRFVRRRIAAEVSSRDDHNDAVRDRVLDRLHEPIGGRRVVDRMAERQIVHRHVQLVAVLDDVIDRVDDVARYPLPSPSSTFTSTSCADEATPWYWKFE